MLRIWDPALSNDSVLQYDIIDKHQKSQDPAIPSESIMTITHKFWDRRTRIIIILHCKTTSSFNSMINVLYYLCCSIIVFVRLRSKEVGDYVAERFSVSSYLSQAAHTYVTLELVNVGLENSPTNSSFYALISRSIFDILPGMPFVLIRSSS